MFKFFSACRKEYLILIRDMAGLILLFLMPMIMVVILALDKKEGRLVGKPDIVSRGFVDVEHDGSVIDRGKELVAVAFGKGHHEHSAIHTQVKEMLSRFFYEQTKRRPMIITTAIEV